MSVIPCCQNKKLQEHIKEVAEILKTESHKLGDQGLSENDFYNSGLFRGAIERIRGQFSAIMGEKRNFVKQILNYMQDQDYIIDWESAGESNRHDYVITMESGKTSVIELKGCLDGNNTNIFERPPNAEEFIIWSVCTNKGADPRKNAWSGIHTRLSAEIISRKQSVDSVIIWDMICGTVARQCPKIKDNDDRLREVGPYKLPPPCIYLLPGTLPSARNNPHPAPQKLENVELLNAFKECFGGKENEINYVTFNVGYHGSDTVRSTKIERAGIVQKESKSTSIRRSRT